MHIFHFRQVLHGTAGGMSGPLQVQARNQQVQGAAQVSIDTFFFFFLISNNDKCWLLI